MSHSRSSLVSVLLLACALWTTTPGPGAFIAKADPPPRLPPIPANDDFANRTPLTGEAVAQPVYLTSSTVEPFEIGLGWPPPTAGSVWWSWTAPKSGTVTVTLLDEVSRAGGDPRIDGYGQSTCGVTIVQGLSAESITVVAKSLGYAKTLVAQTTFQAAAGQVYQIQTVSDTAPLASFTLKIGYDLPPEIVLAQPALNAEFKAGDTIPLLVRCLDPDNAVTNVILTVAPLYAEAVGRWELRERPFGLSWSTAIPGRYRVEAMVEDACGAVRLAVPVEIDVRPVNDAFADRATLDGESFDVTAWARNSTHETFGSNLNSTDIWWRWTAPRSGPFTVVVDETPGFYPRVDVFTGGRLTELQTVASNAYNGWFGVPYETMATFRAVAGVEYAIEVSSSSQCTLRGVYSEPPQVEIVAPLNNPTVMTPEPVTLEVNATDPDDGIARVEFWLDFNLIGTVTNAPYRFVYDTSGEWGVQRSFTARAVDHHGLTTVSTSEYFTILHQPTPPPANDNFADRATLPQTFTNLVGSNYLATREAAETGVGGPNVWWSWTASRSGYHTILLQAMPGYSIIAYRGDSLESLEPVATSRQVAQVQNPFGPNQIEFWESELTLNAEAGVAYALSVARDASDPFGNSFLLAIIDGARPSVQATLSPAETQLFSTTPVTISATASDLDGVVRQVAFTLYGIVGTNVVLTEPPYQLTLTNLPESGYTCFVTATDDQGLASAPVPVNFGIQPPTPQPPPGDTFAERIPIDGPRVTKTGSIENSRSGSVWYAWTAPSTGAFTITFLSEDGRYPNLYIWTGIEETNLTAVADYRYAGTEQELDYTARLVLNATGGQVYIIQLNAGWFSAGYKLDIQDSRPPTCKILFPKITNTIRGVDSFVITATAFDPEGAIDRVECFYDRELVSALTQPPYQWVIPVRDTAPGGHHIRINVYDDHGLEWLDVQNGVMVYPVPPVNDLLANATVLQGFAANTGGSLSGATVEPGEPGATGGVDAVGASVWFAWRAPADGDVILAMDCGGAAMDLYYTDPGSEGDVTRLHPILQGSYPVNNTLHQHLWRATEGVDYRIAVRAKAYNFAQYNLRLILVPDRAGDLSIALPNAGGAGIVALHVSGLPGARTVVETSVDLVHWEPVGTGDGDGFDFLQTPAPVGNSRFYRTVTWP